MQLTKLDFHPLTFVPEGADVLVGRADTESYALLPVDGAALLEQMANGMSPESAAGWYAETYGQPIDLSEFVADLDELGFLRHDEPATAPAAPVRLRWLGRALLSRAALCCYAAVVCCAVVMMVRHPLLRPHADQVFFTRSLLLVQVLVLFGQVPWMLLHESFHVLAGRRLGLPSTVGMGTRLHVFVVVETRMNGLLGVPRGKRYLPYLAGMIADLVAVSGLELIAYTLRDGAGGFTLGGRIAQAMAFPILVRFAYQFQLFLQTDVYFVVAAALGCHDLHAATRAIVLNWVRRLTGRSGRLEDLGQWSERDQRVAGCYAPFFAAGVAVLLGMWLLALLPVLFGVIRLSVRGLSAPIHQPLFWDTALFLAINAAQFGFYFYLTGRNYLRHRRTRTRRHPV
jgi:hypothetical protein